MEFFISAVNKWFPRILPTAQNSEVFFEMTDIEVLRDMVLNRLDEIKVSTNGGEWYRDKSLIGLFDRLYRCGCITLPANPVDRIRWLALACVFFARQSNFDLGNVIIPLDYVTDAELEQYGECGTNLITKTRSFRVELEENGWNSLL